MVADYCGSWALRLRLRDLYHSYEPGHEAAQEVDRTHPQNGQVVIPENGEPVLSALSASQILPA